MKTIPNKVNHPKFLLVTALLALHGAANAAIVVESGDVVTGTPTGTLLAIDTPFENTAVDASDLGWALLSGAAGNNSGSYGQFWEPNGSTQDNTDGQKFITGTVTWTFDIPDGSIIHAVYVSWGKTQGNTPGGTYSYDETASDSEYLDQSVLPAGDLELGWTDSDALDRIGAFTKLGFSPITVTGGNGFVLTTIADGVTWSDTVVIDYSSEAPAPLALNITTSGNLIDLEWANNEGKQYDLLSTDDLAANPDPSLWSPYNDGVTTYENIDASETGTNILTGVTPLGTTRFFALLEK